MEASNSTSSTWSISPVLLCLCALPFVASLLFLLHRSHDRHKIPNQKSRLPPGPSALLFLAKFLVQRQSVFNLEPFLCELHARHGPVISLHLLGSTFVFVSDRRLAHRVLVQGGATFSDRPQLGETDRLFTAGDITSAPYGPYWRLVRRNLATEVLHRDRVSLFEPARQWACDALVRDLRRARGNVEDGDSSSEVVVTLRPFLRRAMMELFMYTCFAVRLGHDELDEIDQLGQRILLSISAFPVFALFPEITKRLFRKRWAANVALRRRMDELFVPLIHATRSRDDPPCYADSLLALRVAEEGNRPLTDSEMVALCTEFLSAGPDKIGTLVEWIMAELVNHPDVQAKLHEEVTAINKLETQAATPYLRAVVLEGLRLHPPVHFVTPHGLQSDAEIGGYAVPRSAEVNFMLAAMGRDETVWTAAREFRPERFLDGGEGCGVDITGSREIKMMPFSAGRRICPGYPLVMPVAECFVASMVRELEWRPPKNGDGVDMTEQLDPITDMKYPLRARIIPRS